MKWLLLALLFALPASAIDGRYGQASARRGPFGGNPAYIECSSLPDPANTPVAVTNATDLHTVAMTNCTAGCILELAPGTYSNTNVVFGDTAIKASSITPTGEVLIRGADPSNPPVLVAAVDTKAAVVHVKNVTARIRLEDVILDGNRANQTSGVLTTVCTDDNENAGAGNGICDSDSPSASNGFANGFNTRSTINGITSSCLHRVTVRNTVNNGISIGYARKGSTVQDSTVYDIGCTATTCPSLSVPLNSSVNSQLVQSMGIQFYDSQSGAVIGSTVHDVSKIGIECFLRAYGCQFIGNTVYDAFNVGIAFTGGDGKAATNTIYSIGYDHIPNATTDNLGIGILYTVDIDNPPTGRTTMSGNWISGTWGSGIEIGIPAGTLPPKPVLATVSSNVITGACTGTTRADVAAYELGDSTTDIQEIIATDNTASNAAACPQVFKVRNLLHYTERRNVVSGSTGGNAVEYDNVDQLDSRYLVVSDDINIDTDTRGRLYDCALGSGSALTGTTTNVLRSGCGS